MTPGAIELLGLLVVFVDRYQQSLCQTTKGASVPLPNKVMGSKTRHWRHVNGAQSTRHTVLRRWCTTQTQGSDWLANVKERHHHSNNRKLDATININPVWCSAGTQSYLRGSSNRTRHTTMSTFGGVWYTGSNGLWGRSSCLTTEETGATGCEDCVRTLLTREDEKHCSSCKCKAKEDRRGAAGCEGRSSHATTEDTTGATSHVDCVRILLAWEDTKHWGLWWQHHSCLFTPPLTTNCINGRKAECPTQTMQVPLWVTSDKNTAAGALIACDQRRSPLNRSFMEVVVPQPFWRFGGVTPVLFWQSRNYFKQL